MLVALLFQWAFRSISRKHHSLSLILFSWLVLLLFYRVIVTAVRVRSSLTEIELFPILIGLCVLASIVIWRLDFGPRVAKVLNVFLSVFLLISLFNNFTTWKNARDSVAKFVDAAPKHSSPFTEQSPDIYLIILDGYLRGDRLRAQIGYDNEPFLNSMRDRGYVIGDQTLANYSQTLLSVSSVLNMSLMEEVVNDFSEESKNRLVFRELFAKNRVMRMLKQGGYETRVFSSGFEHTSLRDADYYRDDWENFFTRPAPALLFGYTFLPDLFDYFGEDYRYKAETVRIINTLMNTPVAIESQGPRFTLSHIMSPHYPLTFDKKGGHLENSRPYRNAFHPSQLGDAYIEQFKDELDFLNEEVLILLDRISNNGRESIVVLISDHGTNLKESDGPAHYKNLMGALLAVSVPSSCKDLLVLNQALANTFQSVLNPCFSMDIEMVQARYRSSTWSKPFKMIDVEEHISNE